MLTFIEKVQAKWDEEKLVCVGLDSEFDKIPQSEKEAVKIPLPYRSVVMNFNLAIVEATADIVCAYKPNLAFYLAHGQEGLFVLTHTIAQIRRIAPRVPVILDAKDMDIGNTNIGYVKMAFDQCGADAITVNPYLGMEAAQPFLDQKGKGIIVLDRTSNKGAGEFQDRLVVIDDPAEMEDLEPFVIKSRLADRSVGLIAFYKLVAYRVSKHWNKNGNCALVVGATYPAELAEVRRIVGDMLLLIPGIGAQGGDVEATVKAGQDSRGQGMIINSSRGIIFASSEADFAEAARREALELHNFINQYRN